MDKRLYKITNLVKNYSKGRFDKHLKVSPLLDEIDGCITSINMLGEELKEATISRDYFNNIFNSVTDMVFVLDRTGIINDINLSVVHELKCAKADIKGRSIREFFAPESRPALRSAIKQLRIKDIARVQAADFLALDGTKLPVSFNASRLINKERRSSSILLVAKNTTEQLQAENKLLRAVIETEERERQRLARDLHDSLGQKLSSIKFNISTCMVAEDKIRRLRLLECNEQLVNVLAEMRAICFNLVPKTLKDFGLLAAIKDLCNEIAISSNTTFNITHENLIVELPVDISTDIFRIIQEFITNAQKHGSANRIKINLLYNGSNIIVNLRDNGKGFRQHDLVNTGLGLQNVISRVKSHNGEIKISRGAGKGTEYSFSIPLK